MSERDDSEQMSWSKEPNWHGSAGWRPHVALRDWFAGQALPLALADYDRGVPQHDLEAMFGGRCGLTRQEIVAALSYRYADAMLAGRSK